MAGSIKKSSKTLDFFTDVFYELQKDHSSVPAMNRLLKSWNFDQSLILQYPQHHPVIFLKETQKALRAILSEHEQASSAGFFYFLEDTIRQDGEGYARILDVTKEIHHGFSTAINREIHYKLGMGYCRLNQYGPIFTNEKLLVHKKEETLHSYMMGRLDKLSTVLSERQDNPLTVSNKCLFVVKEGDSYRVGLYRTEGRKITPLPLVTEPGPKIVFEEQPWWKFW